MTNSPSVPPKLAWINRIWTMAQPVLVRESIVILQSVIKGGELLLSRLETRSGQLQLPAPSPESSYLLKAQPWLQSLGQKWWQLMTWLRGKLPQAWQGTLTETGLTAIFIGILLIVLWPSPSQAPATPPPPKSRPTPTLAPPPPQTTVLVKPRPAPTVSTPVPVPPKPTETDLPQLDPTSETPRPEPPLEAEGSPVYATNLEAEPIAEAVEEPMVAPEVEVKEPEIVETPAIPSLTPQEAALAQARTQFSSISDRYQPGLVADLSLDQQTRMARLTLTPAWYALSASQQDRLAQDLWQQRDQLELSQLLITDSSGQVLVRPPIIGQKPVIVHRGARVP